MPKEQAPAANRSENDSTLTRESPLSLNRLREAFAAMLGAPAPKSEPATAKVKAASPKPNEAVTSAPCEISPRSVVESLLFVGRPDNGPISARELAAAMRGVSPKEVETAVAGLGVKYAADSAPYHIEQSPGGYRLVLRPEFERVRDKFYGKVKEARMSPAALEVLSVLAYNQPATVDQLNDLRGAACGAALSTLVRRKLVRIDRSEGNASPHYSTTDRFLQLFGLQSLGELPRSEDVEKV